MSEIKVSVVNLKKQTVYGLWKNSNDSTVSKDIKNLSKKYHIKVSSPGSKVFPYFVLSRNYNELSKDFEMFVGGTIDKKGLESLIIPNGEWDFCGDWLLAKQRDISIPNGCLKADIRR